MIPTRRNKQVRPKTDNKRVTNGRHFPGNGKNGSLQKADCSLVCSACFRNGGVSGKLRENQLSAATTNVGVRIFPCLIINPVHLICQTVFGTLMHNTLIFPVKPAEQRFSELRAPGLYFSFAKHFFSLFHTRPRQKMT